MKLNLFLFSEDWVSFVFFDLCIALNKLKYKQHTIL